MRCTRECSLDSVHLVSRGLDAFVGCSAGSSQRCVKMSSYVSSFMFDETRAWGSWKAYPAEEFPADEVVCKSLCFFGFHFSSYVENVLVSEEKGESNVGS